MIEGRGIELVGVMRKLRVFQLMYGALSFIYRRQCDSDERVDCDSGQSNRQDCNKRHAEGRIGVDEGAKDVHREFGGMSHLGSPPIVKRHTSRAGVKMLEKGNSPLLPIE